MKTRQLGSQGLTVSELGLGCMGMSTMYGAADQQEALRTLDTAIELGITFWDTAEVYGPHKNEQLLSVALRGKREQIMLATKFGFKWNEKGQINGLDSSPQNIRRAVEGSLQRLNTDYIDLLYQHRVDPSVPIEEVVGVMAELVEQGKVRYLGLSEAGAETIRRAHAVHPISALQSEYSLWERNAETRVFSTLKELNIGLVPYCPLGRGFLTGEIKSVSDLDANDFRRSDPRFQDENFEANMQMVNQVRELALQKNATPAQIAIAWILHQGVNIVPIPGTKKAHRLRENAGAIEVHLNAEELATLNAIGETAGPRYTPERMAFIDL